MSSKSHEYAAWAEVISAAAVVITLAILIVEVRDNTSAIKANAAATTRDSLASSNDLVMQLDTDYLALVMRSNRAGLDLSDFEGIERFRIIVFQRSFFRRAEAQFFAYRAGLLEENVWETVRGRVIANLTSPVWVEIWKRDRTTVYTREFVEEVENHIDIDNPPEPGWYQENGQS